MITRIIVPFNSYHLGSKKLKNRLVLAPMTTYSSSDEGIITPEEIRFLARRAESGFGTIMTAACYVHKSGHAFPGQWRCDSDDVIESSLKPTADAIRAGGATSILQIHHGGRMCPASLCGEVISASAVQVEREGFVPPRAMTLKEIETVITAFGDAARRAEQAGFDGVEIHGANTYLLQQFVSHLTNQRLDAFGQDRYLFSCRIVEDVLSKVSKDFLVGYRFSPEEIETPGIRLEDTFTLLNRLCVYPLHFLHVSLGSYRQPSLHDPESEPVLALLARQINHRIPLIGVGSVNTYMDVSAASKIGADLVAVGRAAITEPDWADVATQKVQPRLELPTENGDSTLEIPPKLYQRLLSRPGWIKVEEKATTS
jgi:2,4-dienoyl-CoA reductase-like NADH-dependent reductase (Old Yellow Enzyme family)